MSGAREASPLDAHVMALALDAAGQGPLADPNPRVGAVILDAAGQIAAVGHHRGSGSPHAEVDALARAGQRAWGGTAYVTLEPCDHHGRTGPCTQALIAAGVARVVYAQDDPNPKAAGGAATLRAAGVAVQHGPGEAAAAALNATWTAAMQLGRPVVTWKYAASLDGRSAAADGTSRWITGEPARADVHARRATCGAIVVGTGTALGDDPRLTVRAPGGALAPRQPLRVVVGHRDLPAGAHLLDDEAPTLHVRTHDPREVLAMLHTRGVRHAWLEGGPRLAAAFLQAGLVDEVIAYVAPLLLGAGPAALADLGVHTIAGAHRLQLTGVDRIGDDVRLILRPVPAAVPPAAGRAEAAHPQSGRTLTEAAHRSGTHTEPTHTEPTHTEPTHTEPTHIEPTHAGTAAAAPRHHGAPAPR